jgi:hypothetical protein
MKRDRLDLGRKFIEKLMAEAMIRDSPITLEDKLKIWDRWDKMMKLEQAVRSGGMGSGFDVPGDDDETGSF